MEIPDPFKELMDELANKDESKEAVVGFLKDMTNILIESIAKGDDLPDIVIITSDAEGVDFYSLNTPVERAVYMMAQSTHIILSPGFEPEPD